MHQPLRFFRLSVGRKTSERANKIDVLRRLHLQSNQVIRARIEKLKPKKRKQKIRNNADDLIVESFFVEDTNIIEREDESDQNSNDSFESEENNEIDNNMEVEP